MCRACCGVCAERVEWLTLRAVCPVNSIGNEGAEHLALALSKNNTLLNLNLAVSCCLGGGIGQRECVCVGVKCCGERHGEGSELGASVDGVVSTDTVGECVVRAAQGSGTQQPAAAVLCVVLRAVNSKSSGQ